MNQISFAQCCNFNNNNVPVKFFFRKVQQKYSVTFISRKNSNIFLYLLSQGID